MAAKGYPGTPETGGAIDGIEAAERTGAKVFHAGTRRGGGGWSRRADACSPSPRSARPSPRRRPRPITRSTQIDFPTGFCRRDIGWREFARG